MHNNDTKIYIASFEGIRIEELNEAICVARNIAYIISLGDLCKYVKEKRDWSSRSWDQLKRELLEAFGSYCVWFPSLPDVAFCRSPDYTFSLLLR